MADELDPVEQVFEADLAEYVAAVEDAVATAQEFAGANEEAQAAVDGLRDHAAEAGAALGSVRDGAAEAAAADDGLRDSAAETAAALGHLRDEAVEAAAAMRELRDSEAEAGAAGVAAEGGGLSLMAVAIIALIGVIAAVAPAIAAVGLALGGFAVFAIPTIMQITAAVGDTKAQVDKLPNGIRQAVQGVQQLEGAWKKLSAAFQPEVLTAVSTALQIAGSLMQEIAPIAMQGAFAVNRILDALQKGVDSKGFATFLADMGKLVLPATDALIKLGGTILGILGNALEQLAPLAVPFISMLTNLLKAASPALIGALKFIGTTIMDIGKAITPALGPLGKFFGYLNDHPVFAQITAGIVGIVAAVKLWTIAQGIFNAVMDANPYVLIGLALVALAILIATHTHQIAEAFDKVRHAVAELGHDVAAWFDRIRHDVAAAVDAVISWVKAHWPILLGILLGPVALAAGEIVQHWNTIKKDATQVIGAVISWFKSNWKMILSILLDPVGTAVMEIRQHWTQIVGAAADLRHGVASAFDGIRHDVAAIFDGWVGDMERNWDTVRHDAAAVMDWIPQEIATKFDQARHDAAAAAEGIVHDVASNWDQFRHDAAALLDDVVGWFTALPGRLIAALVALPGQMLAIGENVIKGLINGIKDAALAIPGIMSSLASDVASYFTDPLKLFSPSRLFFEHGWNIVQGAINGVKANAPQLLATMRGLGTGVGTAGIGAAGAVAPAGGSTSVHVTAPLTVQAGSGYDTPQFQQYLQRAMQEATLRYGQLNPGNGLTPAWGR